MPAPAPAEDAVLARPARSRGAYVALLVTLILLTVLRLWKLELDPPRFVVYGYTGQAHFRDEAAKAHEARNKAVWDEWSLSEYDDYAFWRAQSPAWVYGEYAWFRAFGVGLLQARVFVVVHTVLALALLMWLAMVRHGLPAALGTGLLLGLNWSYLVYSRLALMEGALICWLLVATVMLSQLERRPERAGLWSMLAVVAMLVACTIKQTGLLVVPAFSITLLLLGLRAAGTMAGLDDADAPWHVRLRARLRRPEARVGVIAVATLGIALLLLVTSPGYQQRLAFNANHFIVAREQSVWLRALDTLVHGLFSFRIQLMFTRLAPLILWLATLELARVLWLTNLRLRAAKRGEPAPAPRGELEAGLDPIDLWMLAWAIFALLANLASPHRAIRFQLVMLPPAAWLAGAFVARSWRHAWPSPRWTRAVRAGLVSLALIGTTFTTMRFVDWMQTRGASFAWVGDELEQLLGEREAVVVGEFAAQAVFETNYKHFYVRPDQFNCTPETLRALGITHVITENPAEDWVFELLEDEVPELLVGRRKIGVVHFRRSTLEVWELASDERRAEIEEWSSAKKKRAKLERKRDAKARREAKAAHGRVQRRERACLPQVYVPPPAVQMTPLTPAPAPRKGTLERGAPAKGSRGAAGPRPPQ